MMKTNTRRPWPGILSAAVLLGATLLIQTACSVIPEPTADPTRYFLLGAATENAPSARHGTLHLGIRAVELPGYLRNTRSMVVRRDGNEVRFEDFARWAEPLDAGVSRVVRDRLLNSDLVATADIPPFVGGPKRDFDLVIRVTECSGEVPSTGQSRARFAAIYEVFDVNKGGELVERRSFVAADQPWNGTDFSQLAARLGEGAAALGADIAQNLPH